MNKLILTGFMGTGKTTLAQLLSIATGIQAVDTDVLISQAVGMTIPEIFERFGEAGFRAWETAILQQIMAKPDPLIVSGGGGLFLHADNRKLAAGATIICLTASPEAIFDRLKATSDRPLLHVEDPLAEIKRLLLERKPIYRQFRWQVDTTQHTPEELVPQIQAIWQRDQQLRQHEVCVVTPEGFYPILFQRGALRTLQEILDVHGFWGHRLIVGTDDRVADLYGERVLSQLENAALVTMPSGESYKNLSTVNTIYEELARLGLDRNGVILALGGGVVGDTFGYVAATYLRGVRFVQIPTTLLAMVDSSVGGKVGVDVPMGKNLIGAFKQPNLVIIDPDVLNSLPAEEHTAGMAEVIKHGLLSGDRRLLDLTLPMETRLRAAVQVKIDIVQRDPYEQGERAYLNLGHTFAHAIERASMYQWRHGDAVGVGLIAAARLSHALGLLSDDDRTLIEDVVSRAGLPTSIGYLYPQVIWDAMGTDKKWRDGQSHFIVLKGIGQPSIVKNVPRDTVIMVLESLRNE